MRLIPTDPDHLLHAHSVDATVQAFFAGLSGLARAAQHGPQRQTTAPAQVVLQGRVQAQRHAAAREPAHPLQWSGKCTAGLILAMGASSNRRHPLNGKPVRGHCDLPDRGSPALRKRRCPCKNGEATAHTVGIDLGEVHPAVSCDGERAHLLNGRLLRSKRQYRNKLIAKLDAKISRCKQRGKRRRKLILAKKKCLSKLKHQIQDIEHKLTSYLVNTLHREGVENLVIGDVRARSRHGLDKGSTTNQKLHHWSFGSIRHKLTYKAERLGMRVVVQEESYTSRTCPMCGHRRKSAPAGRVFRCTNKTCQWQGHRDGVGAANIRAKYRGEFGGRHVIGAMAPPTGCGYVPQLRVSL